MMCYKIAMSENIGYGDVSFDHFPNIYHKRKVIIQGINLLFLETWNKNTELMNQKYVCVQKNKAQDHFCNIIVPSMGGGETERLVGELFAPYAFFFNSKYGWR